MNNHNPRSRIPREFFYILNSTAKNFRALVKLDSADSVRIGHVLVLLAIYMLREEGKEYFNGMDVVTATDLPRSTVYRALEWLEEHHVIKTEGKEYTCVAQTPEFLLEPHELYTSSLEKPPDIIPIPVYTNEMILDAIHDLRAAIPGMIENHTQSLPEKKSPEVRIIEPKSFPPPQNNFKPIDLDMDFEEEEEEEEASEKDVKSTLNDFFM